jgi:hypothetical protein
VRHKWMALRGPNCLLRSRPLSGLLCERLNVKVLVLMFSLGNNTLCKLRRLNGNTTYLPYNTACLQYNPIPLNLAFEGPTAQIEQPTEILESPIRKMILDLSANYWNLWIVWDQRWQIIRDSSWATPT